MLTNGWAHKGFRAFGLVCIVVVLISARIVCLSESTRPFKAYQKNERIVLGRGMIMSSDGSVLAVSLPKYLLSLDPVNFDETRASELAVLLKEDPEKLAASIKLAKSRGSRYLVLVRSADSELAAKLGALQIDGVQIDVSWRRHYPFGALFAHVVGFANRASSKARAASSGDSPEAEGKYGIEAKYDRYLIPKAGELRGTFVARFSHPLLTRGLEGVDPPSFGHQIVLNTDLWLQRVLEEELQGALDKLKAAGAWGVILDSNTGAVLALVSLPSFDPNQPELGSHFNLAISAQTEPGSVMKPYSLAAALESGIPLDTKIDCENGHYKVGKYDIDDVHPQGILTLPEIVEVSSNIGICKLAQMTGKAKFYEVFTKFGFGKKTGIDLVGEMPGEMRTPGNPYWSRYDLIANSYGQGLSTTGIGLATTFASLVNGGKLYKPQVVREIRDQWGNVVTRFEPELIGQPISEQTSLLIREVLKRVIDGEHGTGRAAKVSGIGMVGKTGTAWKIDDKGHYIKNRYIATFIGAFPLPNPSYVIVVSVDDPKGPEYQHYAAYAAAPVFKRVVERMLALSDGNSLDQPAYMVAADYQPKSKSSNEGALLSNFLSGIKTLDGLHQENKEPKGESD